MASQSVFFRSSFILPSDVFASFTPCPRNTGAECETKGSLSPLISLRGRDVAVTRNLAVVEVMVVTMMAMEVMVMMPVVSMEMMVMTG